MKLDPAYETALSSPDPVESLRTLAMYRLVQGHDRSAITASFEEARRQLRLADREADEDAMMDALDGLVGWCSPHMLLAPASNAPELADLPADAETPSRNGGVPAFDVLTNEIRVTGRNMQPVEKRI